MAKGFKHGAGGGTSLNFKVIGNPQPETAKDNTIWVNTSTPITNWYFGTEEPNVYNLALHMEADWHTVAAPHELSAGEILSFVIPKSAPNNTFEALAITDNTGKFYYIRESNGAALGAWIEGVKISVRISNDINQIGAYAGHGTAYLISWDSYYHKEGTVWISIGTSSAAEFNALKKNGIMVYPIRANQYVNGAWVGKTAKTYQKGTWVEWATSLYKAGGVNTAGWSVYDPAYSDHTLMFGTTHMILTIPDSTGVGRRTTFHTDMLDLTNAKTLSITMKNTNNVTIGVASAYSTSTTWITSRGASAQSDFTTHTFDVSAINSGMVALRFEVNAYKTGLTATFESVYLT